MRYTNQFRRFDPLKGDVPSFPFFGHLRQIAVNARRILKGRTVAELHSAAQVIDRAIDRHIAAISRENKRSGGDAIDRSDFDDVRLFMRVSDHIKFKSNDDFPDGNFPQYCAVLSLWQLIDAIDVAGMIPGTTPNAERDPYEAAEYALQAMQAFCIGNEWQIVDGWKRLSAKGTSVIKKQSEAGKKAAEKSHHIHHEMQKHAIALYFSNYSDWSVKKAAPHVVDEMKQKFKCSPITVAKWIYAEKKKRKKQT